jgi:Domain of unknown function (DUF4136)
MRLARVSKFQSQLHRITFGDWRRRRQLAKSTKENVMLSNTKSAVIPLGAAALLFLAYGSMFAQDVKYNFMPGTNFSKYHTYKWVSIQENVHPSQIVDQEIKQAIDAQLSAKGFIKTDDDKADMYLGYQCSVDQERQWNGYGGGRFGGMGSVTSSTIQNGTLAVDFYDPADKQLIWRGQATKTLNPGGNQQKNMQKLNKAMAKLLKNFPPPPPK